MLHPDLHLRSNPEDTFDQWLDALVSGTPGDAASLDGTDGSLGRAAAGARQLHGLATRATPATAAQRRIEEDLMRSGALAAPGGMTWIPVEKERRRAPWWSPASPVIAWALIVALIVALSASFIASQRPAPPPDVDSAPGFAMASPDAEEARDISELPIVVGDPGDELRNRFGSYGVIDDHGLTITRPGEDDLVFPGVVSAYSNGVPGEAVVIRDDDTRSVVDLTTGETRFDLPNTSESESQAGTYLFVSETGENADWTIWDLRTGESRPLSEIVDLPADQPVIPVPIGFVDQLSPTVSMQFVTPEFETGKTTDIPSFVIAGSLDRATTIAGYPPASHVVISFPVVSPDNETVAWAATEPENAIVVADTATGEELARYDLGDVPPYAQPVGFTEDGEHLVATNVDRVMLFSWADDEPEQQVVAEGLDGIGNPLLYAPTESLYFREGSGLKRLTIPDGDITTVVPELTAETRTRFTAEDAPWIIANEGGNAALIDARTGEVVSKLSGVPANPDQHGAYTSASSFDGSTVLFQQGGLRSEYTAWLVSPRFPDGLSFTPPIDPSMIEPDQIFPVSFILSPDGRTMFVGTIGDTGFTPRLIGQVAPNPEWVEIDANLSAAYWLPMLASEQDESDAVTLPAQDFATPMPSATGNASCATTAPNGAVPTGENANLDWLGSGAASPSLWLMMTWDDGTITTEQAAGGYPVKLTFWRGEGSGDVTVTAIGPGGETLAPDTFAPFRATVIPGIHPIGGELPEPGCWTFTATDGNDTLTWTVDVQDIAAASPAAASGITGVIVVEGSAAEARVENGVAIATLGDDGLTLPVEAGVSVSLPDVVQIDDIGPGVLDRLLIVREDGTRAVVDLATGDALFEVPPFQTWAQDEGDYLFIPTDDTLIDWTVVDLTTGETRQLSDIVDLPGDTAVMPSGVPPVSADGASVFQLALGKPDASGFITTDPAARTFVVAGSLDRAAPLPDYPTARDNVGTPTLVASADGNTVAYETRAGDSRIVVLDVTSGKVLGRYSATEVGENPALAGFAADGRIVATDGTRVITLDPAGGDAVTVADGFERLDNPLIHTASGLIYARDIDTLQRIDLTTGEVTEVATGLVPAPFGFTTPGGNWIVAQTRDGHIMVDARTGEVVSRMQPDPTRASFLLPEARHPAWVDADGDTFFIALRTAPAPPGAADAMPAVWLLSPDFPDGLEVTGPEDTAQVWLSPDGGTLYAFASERPSGPGTIWRTPLEATPDWQVVAEDVTPAPKLMMFFTEW